MPRAHPSVACPAEVPLATLRRRLVTIPTLLVVTALVVGALPLWLVLAAAVDSVRKLRGGTPFAVTRLVAFAAVYLVAEVLGVLVLFAVWLGAGVGRGRRARLLAATHATQRAWVHVLLTTVKGLYGLRIALVGEDTLGPAPGGPAIVLMQHTSLIDTLLPTTYLTARRGLGLRWVLKRELLVDPALDIAGRRLPNAFVGRDGSDTERALAELRALASDLPCDQAVLIYPEGTRFTPAKRRKALARLAAASPHSDGLAPALGALARAERLRRVLPPRLGGALALLEAAPDADVVFIGHVGFEGMASLASVLSGALVGRVVQVRFWRYPRRDVPREREALVAWLWDRWEELDAWVDATAAVTPR